MMHVIIDYGVGNIASVMQGFKRANMETIVSSDPSIIKEAHSLILPGVGAFKDAMEALNASGLIPLIKSHVENKKPLLGICLGLQLLYERSEENGGVLGLGFLRGTVRYLDVSLKVPHMGWNILRLNQAHAVLKNTNEEDFAYFIHSYYVDGAQDEVIAYADYGKKVAAVIAKDNIVATQFHPEKSGLVGEGFLKAYEEWIK